MKKNDYMKAALLAPMAAFSLVVSGCESKTDIARKPDVIEDMLAQSLQKCVRADDVVYSEKLRHIMGDVRTKSLETIRSNGATICLDQRLSQQERIKTIYGVYYNRPDGDILSLWDDGRSIHDRGIFDIDATDYGASMLTDLAEEIAKGSLSDAENAYGARYTRTTGKTTSTYSDWREARYFSKKTIKNNPDIVENAPVLKMTGPGS